MNERTREIIKMALLYFQSNREDFCAGQWEAASRHDQFSVNGCPCEPPTEEEVAAALNEFQDVL